MINVTIFLYQLIGLLYTMIIPLGMLMCLLWLLVKMGKIFVRSILK